MRRRGMFLLQAPPHHNAGLCLPRALIQPHFVRLQSDVMACHSYQIPQKTSLPGAFIPNERLDFTCFVLQPFRSSRSVS